MGSLGGGCWLDRVGEGISDKGGPEQKPEGSKEPGIWMSGEAACTWPVPGTAEASHVRDLTESSCPLC